MEYHSNIITVVEEYNIQEKYNIQATKSCTLVFNHSANHCDTIAIEKSAKHLRLIRSKNIQLTVEAKLNSGRKALYHVYGLMEAGLHGINGLNQMASMHIMNIYIVPNMTYGLEALVLPQRCIYTFEISFRRVLRQLQSLP